MNESRLDFARLEAFYEVARLGGLSKAARSLGLSQPAVSHRIRLLSEDLGVRLFEPLGRGLRLTPKGLELRDECVELFARARRVRERLSARDGAPQGRVRIGTYAAIARHLLAPVLTRLVRAHPALSFGLELALEGALIDALRAGEVDLLVLIAASSAADGTDATTLGRDRLVAAMSPRIAPRKRGRVSPRELRAMRHLAWSGPRDTTFDLAARYAEQHGLIDDTTLLVPHVETLRALAEDGLGFTLLPSYAVQSDVSRGALVALEPVGLAKPLVLSLHLRRAQILGPGVAAARSALVAHAWPILRGAPRAR